MEVATSYDSFMHLGFYFGVGGGWALNELIQWMSVCSTTVGLFIVWKTKTKKNIFQKTIKDPFIATQENETSTFITEYFWYKN